ncbi:glycoside hydrolase family 38 C-terminal domain-containing protein [Coraliomargarita algicola]|uniref:Glycoside hydrolase family 38 C-terminal domain-containing protein n=1 Tax=Coraliomargarita algicola TaxID=3092156 RepID=A0ABZ0RJ87_9BACT|nr:glycoside hydrolase family 38 C-terminal domain-containing protein [Coraliomargarita sp. J2-16]WPJ96137.1 glycoside hydrolase family 38 C-terminal domain-containing protein [Coraliomargarita sp. J2-16]
MLPNHHLPQLTLNRIQATVNRLKAAVWTDRQAVEVEASRAQAQQLSLAEGQQLKRRKVKPCSFWGKLFDQRWCRVTLSQAADGNTWMEWKDQGEATLYVDGQAYFGFNVAHSRCRLPEGTTEVWLQSSCIQSAIWHPEANGMDAAGSYFEGAFVVKRNDVAWNAYHDLKCLFDLAMDQRQRENPQLSAALNCFGQQASVNKATPVYRRILRGLEDAANELDQKGIPAMRRCLAKLYQELKMDKTFAKCILTGHAHLDLVWIWPERMGELKAVNIFATADRLMEEYPEYRFAYSQPASYEAVAKREPDLYDRVKGRIESGKWQATGAMYVESDTMIACGEALARSFTLGQKGFEAINGALSKLTWLPDVFGYSACLPQIMKQTGVEYFFTTKMTWNAINRFPYSSFIWRGNDGSEILAHVTQDSGYVTHVEVNDVKAPMLANQQADIHGEYLLPTGYGDGGGGVTDDMLERARRLSALPGMPDLEWDQPEAFFDRLNGVRDELPVHQGECYLEYHRGTFTTHGNLKASFRGLERAMQVAEAVAAATGKIWNMEDSWKRLVFAQFHDYIPGSSVWDVYMEDLPVLDGHAAKQLAEAEKALTAKGDDCLFNPHAVEVSKWIDRPDASAFVTLPPLSGSLIEAVIQDAPASVEVKGRKVSNGVVEFRVNASGWIDQLSWEGVEVPLSGPLGQLMLYPDHAAYFEAWDIDRQTLSLGEVCKAKASITAVDGGAHRAGIAVTRKIGVSSEATVTFMLEAGSPLVQVTVDLDWQEPQSLLKLLFPTKYAATNARFGIPYGSVLRKQVPDGMPAEAQWEVPFSRYLAVFDEGEREGLFLTTESKYGATVREGSVGLSLVRSPRVTGFEMHGNAWPAHLTRLKIESPYSDIGSHQIKLAIGRYDAELPRERQPASIADTFFTGPVAYTGKAIAPVIESIEGGESLVPHWVKPTEDGYVLRLHEVAGRRGTIQVHLVDGYELAQTDISESKQMSVNSMIRFSPYEVVSLLVRRS